MKKLIVILTALLFAIPAAVSAQEDQTIDPAEINGPKISWIKDSHDFGEIAQGKPVTVTFEMKNDGNSPLLITNVRPTCGCTTAGYTKEPIAAGNTGTVSATFNAKAVGSFRKSVTITTNAGTQTVYFKGKVLAPEGN